MEFELGIEIIDTAYQKRSEEQLYNRWLFYQDSMSFEEFKAKLGADASITHKEYSVKSSEEIMANVERIVGAVHNGNI
ncbi:MAG: hypothetical protein IKK59_05530 [Lachnospiraceae bacterium]|nr:hypothetical protein [Lachnospiraceae bacterium]